VPLPPVTPLTHLLCARISTHSPHRARLRNRVLIVDAYNVLNEWPALAELFDAGHLEAAREGLVTELKGYAHFKGARLGSVQLVSQAILSDGKACVQAYESSSCSTRKGFPP
jgi:predicted RNA-binding protein with PIN domain